MPRKKGQRWQGRVYDPSASQASGRKVHRTKTVDTKREAILWEAQVRRDLAEGSYVERSRLTLSDWWTKYQETGRWANLRPTTQSRYDSAFRVHILPTLGNRALQALRPIDVASWQGERLMAGTSEPMANAAHRVLKAVLQVAVDTGLLAHNPAKAVKLLRVPDSEQRALTLSEVESIREAIDPRYQAMFLLLAWVGLRFGEAIGLRWEDVDFETGRLRVARQVTMVGAQHFYGPTKTGKVRHLTLPRFLVQELRRLKLSGPPGPLIFQAPDGGPIRHTNWRRRVWLPALEAAGIERPWPRIHDLRHTAASVAFALGAQVREVQSMLGHASPQMTLGVYSHLLDKGENLAERMDALRDSRKGLDRSTGEA